jgi:hypothetical protein
MIKWWRWTLIGVIVILIPFPTTRIAEWHFSVVDQNRRPLPWTRVEMSWYDYDNMSEGFESRVSDANGIVHFPAQKLWGNVVTRVLFPGIAKVLMLAHGSDGLSIYARVYDTELKYVSESNDQIHWYSKWHSDKPLPVFVVGTKQADWNP